MRAVRHGAGTQGFGAGLEEGDVVVLAVFGAAAASALVPVLAFVP